MGTELLLKGSDPLSKGMRVCVCDPFFGGDREHTGTSNPCSKDVCN